MSATRAPQKIIGEDAYIQLVFEGYTIVPADTIAANVKALAEIRAENERLREDLKNAMTPNLFWDDDNPEESFTSIEELADYIGVRSLAIRVRVAKSLPDRWVSAIQGEDAWVVIYHDTFADASAELNRARSLGLLDGEVKP